MLPKSPWEQSFAEIEKDGVPTDDNVADILAAILPLFPTPQIITFDLHAGQIQGFFGPRVPVDNLAGGPVGVEYFAKNVNLKS